MKDKCLHYLETSTNFSHTTTKIFNDVLGTILFELTTLYPLFPGSDETDQINRIHRVLGTPKASVVSKLRKHASDHPLPSSSGFKSTTSSKSNVSTKTKGSRARLAKIAPSTHDIPSSSTYHQILPSR